MFFYFKIKALILWGVGDAKDSFKSFYPHLCGNNEMKLLNSHIDIEN